MDKMGKAGSTTGNAATAKIVFDRDEKQHCFEIGGQSVTVVGNDGKHDHGSSKVKLKNLVDYKWEQKNYPGRLIACHRDGKLIAYAITVNHRAEGVVRIVHLLLGQRALIRKMTGEVLDLQFAHISSNVLLGMIDQVALHVHSVEIINEKVICNLVIKIDDKIEDHVPRGDKISWCPYLQHNGCEDEYASTLVVWTRGTTFQCYSISSVVRHYGAREIFGQDITEGGFRFREPLPVVLGAIFSADGSTLAVSCEDGIIRFYQVYEHANEKGMRCLHQWKPHGGKAVTSFFFLDNYTEQAGDQTLWKHAITCAENNTEIKVWSCETWECTQTITFEPAVNQPELNLKAEIDPTSSFLVLSDMNTRELYVLQIRKDLCTSTTTGNGTLASLATANGKSLTEDLKSSEQNSTSTSEVSSSSSGSVSKAYVSSIAEFPLSSPILSFNILKVAVRKCKTSDAYLIEELDDYDEENNSLYCVVLRIFLVQPKSVQECYLFYQPNVHFDTDVLSTISNISSEYRNISHSSQSATSNKDSESVGNVSNIVTNTVNALNKKDTSLSSSIKSVSNESDRLKELDRIQSPHVTATNISGNISLNNSGSAPVMPPKPAVHLMTPDSFTPTVDKLEKSKHDDTVNPDVLNTIFMLANVTKQQQQQKQAANGTSPNESIKEKPSPLSMLNIVNSTMIEEQEQAKVRKSVELQQKTLLVTPPVPPMPSAEMLASGGSSPSREVQEILSLKENDCLNEYYDSDNILLDDTDGIAGDDDELNDLENEIIDDEDEEIRYNFKNIDDDDDEKEDIQPRRDQPEQTERKLPDINPINVKADSIPEKSLATTESPSSRTIDWPKVPGVPLPPLKDLPQPSMLSGIAAIQPNKQMDELAQKMDRLLNVVELQSRQITELRSQVSDLQKTRTDDSKLLNDTLREMESNVIEQTSSEKRTLFDIHSEKIETMYSKHFSSLNFTIMNTLEPRLTHQIVNRLGTSLNTHLEKTCEQVVGKIMLQFTMSIEQQLLQKFDSALQEGVQKTMRNQVTIDAIGNSVYKSVRKAMETSFHEALRNIILPNYERCSQELFWQLNKEFSAGLKEYLEKTETYISCRKVNEEFETALKEQFNKLRQNLTVNDLVQPASVAALRKELSNDFKEFQGNLLKMIRENVRTEIEKGLEAQASTLEDSVLSAVRSQAQTPAPAILDHPEHIRQLLATGRINDAFVIALQSNDLKLVEFTIKHANYKQVFNPCALEQRVLLSLIQQIAADMSNINELKHRYLSDAIVNLTFFDPLMNEHIHKVLQEVARNIQAFLSMNPDHALATSLKLLMIAIQGCKYA
ncbi:enhancer of mRNA-decapping protein 4 homolog isoform X2 [Uranotaenia lowii]|nr:enhancer of mRNA-decapping protein 4 homolog isoform X2 [Uranotaenia lowii]XP_055597703.1 enhancer of mRNA-decapping protein 4 homolog isoform X2 [Uranotaenia lowii]XP_055597704.1 enhancer of mRNA-decapping protein 4 homolog isoform X2 [Uranotaenia lowii]